MDEYGIELGVAAQFVLGLVFATASIAKLRDLGAFIGAVASYEVLPASASRPAAAAILCTELVLAFAWLSGANQVAVPLTLTAFFAFNCAVALNIRRGRIVSCGCGGAVGSGTADWNVVLRNALLASFALIALNALPGVSPLQIVTSEISRVVLVASFGLLLYFIVGAADALTSVHLYIGRSTAIPRLRAITKGL